MLQDQSNLLTWLAQFWRKLGQVEEWNDPVFENGWVNVGAPYPNAGYYKDPFERVHLRGRIGTGVAATTAFTLPEGYRPNGTIILGGVTITAAGLVQPSASPSSLDGVSFRAEQ